MNSSSSSLEGQSNRDSFWNSWSYLHIVYPSMSIKRKASSSITRRRKLYRYFSPRCDYDFLMTFSQRVRRSVTSFVTLDLSIFGGGAGGRGVRGLSVYLACDAHWPEGRLRGRAGRLGQFGRGRLFEALVVALVKDEAGLLELPVGIVGVKGPRNRKKLMPLACHIDILVNIQGLLAERLRGRIVEARIAFFVLPLKGLDVLGDLGSNGGDISNLREIDTVMDIVERFQVLLGGELSDGEGGDVSRALLVELVLLREQALLEEAHVGLTVLAVLHAQAVQSVALGVGAHGFHVIVAETETQAQFFVQFSVLSIQGHQQCFLLLAGLPQPTQTDLPILPRHLLQKSQRSDQSGFLEDISECRSQERYLVLLPYGKRSLFQLYLPVVLLHQFAVGRWRAVCLQRTPLQYLYPPLHPNSVVPRGLAVRCLGVYGGLLVIPFAELEDVEYVVVGIDGREFFVPLDSPTLESRSADEYFEFLTLHGHHAHWRILFEPPVEHLPVCRADKRIAVKHGPSPLGHHEVKLVIHDHPCTFQHLLRFNHLSIEVTLEGGVDKIPTKLRSLRHHNNVNDMEV